MGQRVQHSANFTSTNSDTKAVSAVTATMKGCLVSMSFAMLVCRVGAYFPCKPEQIHWNSTVGKRPKCFDCPECPPGTEPSVPCGTSVNEWRDIHCVPCKLGKTYSDKYDTSHCKACTICSDGKAVENNCTEATNTKCSSKCGPGFYNVRLISGCFPCAQCCGDGKDEFAAECANNKNKCKVRSAPCTRVQTTPFKSTTRNYSTSNTSPTVQTAGDRTTTVNEGENSVLGELNISVTTTSGLDNEVLKIERVETGKQDGLSIVVILLIVAVALCVVLSFSLIVKRCIPVGYRLRSSREQNSNDEGCNISQGATPPLPHSAARSSQDSATPLLNRSESPQPNESAAPQDMVSTSLHTNGAVSSQPNDPESPKPNRSTSVYSSDSVSPQAREYEPPQPQNTSSSVSPRPREPVSSQPDKSTAAAAAAQSNRCFQEQVKSNPDSKPLSGLLEKESDLQKICDCLDASMPGVGHYRAVAQYYGFNYYQAQVFEKQRGGPSRALIESLQAKKPELTVAEFASVVRKEADRKDVVKLLEEYDLKENINLHV